MDAPSSPPLAQTVFDLLVGHDFANALLLLEQLEAYGLRLIDAPIVVQRRGDGTGRAPLHAGLLERMGEHDPASTEGFHTAASARRLLALAPTMFAGEDGRGTAFWNGLERWGARARAQREKWAWPAVDEWLEEVLRTLPDAAFSGQAADAGWRSLLSFPAPRAMAAFSERQPERWMALDAENRPLLRGAEGETAWKAFLVHGGDPWAVMPDGQPLWRAVLPLVGQHVPDPKTFRHAVEAWVRTQAAAETAPERQEAIQRFQCETTAARMGSSDWVKQPLSARIKTLQGLPIAWLHEPVPGQNLGLPANANVPAWMLPFFVNAGQEAHGWAQALKGIASWREALGPSLDFAVWVLDQRKSEDSAWVSLVHAPERVREGAFGSQGQAVCEALLVLWRTCWEKRTQTPFKGTSRAVRAILDEALLEQTLPASDVGRRAPRL